MLVERSANIEKVKRNLFGAPTKAEKSLFNMQYERSLEENRMEMQKKYNFNFRYELPVLLEEQHYDWEELSTSEVPAMFTPRTIKSVSKTVQKEPSKPKEVKKPTKTRRRTTNFGFSMPRRVSIKRTHEQIPEETSPVKQDKPYKPGAARKLRRVTAEFDTFAAFRPGRKSQRRISDIMEIKRTSPIKPIEVKKAEKKVLSPKSAAIRKVAELSTVMCPSPDRMMTRANTKLLSRTSNRRRTLA